MKNHLVPASLLAVLAILLLAPAAGGQDKLQQCSAIQVTVDLQKGPGNWSNGIATLKLQAQAQGWTIALPAEQQGRNIQARPGQSYRLNFGDGTHPVNVKASGGGGSALEVRAGSREAIVLVDVVGGSGTHVVNFEITGSPNPAAKIGGCPGGNLYFDIGG
jgi:hypothetical protein